MSPATPLEALTARFMFVQGKLIDIDSNTARNFKSFKLAGNAMHVVDVENDLSGVGKLIETFFATAADFSYTNTLTQLNQIIKQRKLRCGFCGKCLDLMQSTGPLLFAAPIQKSQFRAFYNPPVIAIFHSNCAFYCPEVETIEQRIDKVSNTDFDKQVLLQLNFAMKAAFVDRYVR